MGSDDRKDRAEFQALINAHVRDLETAPAEELAEGLSPSELEAEAGRVLDAFKRAKAEAGRRRMDAAKSGMTAYQSASRRPASRPGSAEEARRLTLAARHGTDQSERDRKTLQDDLDELAALRKEDGTE